MEPSNIHIGRKSYTVSHDACEGAIDFGRLTLKSIKVMGWVLKKATKKPVEKVAIMVDGRFHAITLPNLPRPDISREFGESAHLCGFSIEIPVEAIKKNFTPRVTAYALQGDATASAIGIHRPGYFIDFRITNRESFERAIQIPSTRIADKETLALAAYHCYTRFTDYSIRSGAVCVLGYRLLDQPSRTISALQPFFEKVLHEIADAELKAMPNVKPGPYLRWHTSLRLLQGYWNLKNNNLQAALDSFVEVKNHWGSLEYWPSAVCNLLIAALLAGLIYQKNGDRAAAMAQWTGTEQLLRSGLKNAELINTYGFDELINAIHIARECKVGLVASSDGKIEDPNLGFVGRVIDIFSIGNIASLPREIFRTIQ